MKRILLSTLVLCCVVAAGAQASRHSINADTETAWSFHDEIKADPRLSASNYTAYPTPSGRLTPAPVGYTPYYISHYGRHGSRYLINPEQYSRPAAVLAHADSLGLLSDEGRYALAAARRMEAEASKRYGELTHLGAEQHQQIARRMVERFPEVFEGETTIQARSTVVIRCILSMAAEMQELLRHNNQLNIDCDASEHDMYYMNCQDTVVERLRKNPAIMQTYNDWQARHINNQRFIRSLFADTVFADTVRFRDQLTDDIFRLATIAQNSAIGDSVNLYRLFTTDELYSHWQQSNVGWYLTYGASAISDGHLPYSQSNLVRDIVAKADSCLRLQHPGATMRFGHESVVLPLVCLLDIDGYGVRTSCVDSLDNYGWVNTRIFPMACNVQFVFYKAGKHPGGRVLVKVLLNEEEATLPLRPAAGLRFPNGEKPGGNPYYDWADVRRYLLSRAAY